ncbi:MAG TPA: hypothetical protein EYG11_09720 [Candidatus Latescibacteria bacterium]|nr:hypothetical protein [Candidatus Latescibacterota bacterium]
MKTTSREVLILGSSPIHGNRLYLKVEAREQDYSFYYAATAGAWSPVVEKADGRVLSTQIAGGFVGAYIGLYASSNGKLSKNVADFAYFEYVSLPG